MKRIFGCISIVVFLQASPLSVLAAEPASVGSESPIYHATNTSGLTGLFYTSSAYTVPKGSFELGSTVLMERSGTPDYSMVQVPINITYGLTDTIELALSTKMVYLNTIGQGVGDTEINAKVLINEPASWRQGFYIPAVAIGAGLILPTGRTGLDEVNDYGAKAMFMLSSEGRLPNNRYIGTYLDAQVIGKDLSSASANRDIYWVVNLGLMMPWQDDRNFQMIGELNMVTGKDTITLGAGGYTGITLGLRYASDPIKLSTGVQFVNKDSGLGGTTRIAAMASVEL